MACGNWAAWTYSHQEQREYHATFMVFLLMAVLTRFILEMVLNSSGNGEDPVYGLAYRLLVFIYYVQL